MMSTSPAEPSLSCKAHESLQLFTVLYDELHRMARGQLRRNPGATLSPTTLLHEAFLSISRRDSLSFPTRAHFMAYAARAMRGLLINYVRDRKAQRRGGRFEITSLGAELTFAENDCVELQCLGEALQNLEQIDARLAQCVDLKFFCGFSYAEIADMWSVSERTVQREWDKARVLLHRLLDNGAK
jgi:RNA polymerase sigma factor (TIGR02999 family)